MIEYRGSPMKTLLEEERENIHTYFCSKDMIKKDKHDVTDKFFNCQMFRMTHSGRKSVVCWCMSVYSWRESNIQ